VALCGANESHRPHNTKAGECSGVPFACVECARTFITKVGAMSCRHDGTRGTRSA
jgi:hypothetical protein